MDPLTELVLAAQQKVPGAVEALCHEIYPLLRTAARGIDANEADDLVQETMLRLYRHYPSFDLEKASLRSWLYALMRNCFVDGIRRRKKRVAWPKNLEPFREDDPTLRLRQQEKCRHIRKALDQLPSADQQVLFLRYYEEQSVARTAERIGIPPGTVGSRTHRALRKFGDLLDMDEADLV
jgi:RNA polymerase sigma-70 factor (ECF subfamily)